MSLSFCYIIWMVSCVKVTLVGAYSHRKYARTENCDIIHRASKVLCTCYQIKELIRKSLYIEHIVNVNWYWVDPAHPSGNNCELCWPHDPVQGCWWNILTNLQKVLTQSAETVYAKIIHFILYCCSFQIAMKKIWLKQLKPTYHKVRLANLANQLRIWYRQ